MDQQSDAASHRSLLADQLRVLRRRWRLIALVCVFAVAASLAYSLNRVPEFRSTADVLLSPTAFDVRQGGGELTPEEIATQVRIATSQPVAGLVRDDLRLANTPVLEDLVTVEALGSSRVLRITSRMTHPEEAAEVARSVAQSYLVYRQTNTQQTLTEVTSSLAERQQRLETRLAGLDEALADRPDPGGKLAAERREVLGQLSRISAQLADVDISVAGGAGGELLDEPAENTVQVAPRPVLTVALSLLIGLLAGIALALTRDRSDPVAHDEESLVPFLGPAHVLARVPRWKSTTRENRIITISRPESPASQAFQVLVAKVRHLTAALPRRTGRGAVLVCTSASADEGKTDVAVNLAVAAARVGMRVVLVDADPRRRAGQQLPGVRPAAPGLTDVLLDGRRLEQYLVEGPAAHVLILPAGVLPSDPVELFTAARLRPVFAALADQADLVIVDAPGAGYAASLEVAELADVTLLVTRLGRSRLSAVRSAAERLQDVGVEDLQAVVIGGSSMTGDLPRTSRSVPAPGGRRPALQSRSRELGGDREDDRGRALELRQSPRG